MSVVLHEVSNTTEQVKTSAEILQQAGSQMLSVLQEGKSGSIFPAVSPGSLLSHMPMHPPQEGESLSHILQDFLTTIRPSVMKSNEPGNLSFIPVSIDGPAWLGATLALALNQSRAIWQLSPAATEVEQVVLSWLRQMLGLPHPLFGMIHHNSAVLQSLVAARETCIAPSIRKHGMGGARLRLYISEQTHVSVKKAAIVCGIGEEGICTIGTDEAFRMKPEQLEEAIREDRAAGWQPFAVVATIGTTSTGSCDPISTIADICEQNGLWLHIDAAFGGLVALLPEQRALHQGWERADSLTVNPHKWVGIPLSCSVLFTRRKEAFKAAFSLAPDYLRTQEEKDAIHLFDYTDTLPHGFPALALWMQIRAQGHEGLAHRIRCHLELAACFSTWVEQQPELERMAETSLNIVCFRLHPHDMGEEQVEACNQQALATINARGQLALSSTRLRGRLVLRAAFGAMQTDAHILPLLQQEVLSCLGEATIESSGRGASTEKEGGR